MISNCVWSSNIILSWSSQVKYLSFVMQKLIKTIQIVKTKQFVFLYHLGQATNNDRDTKFPDVQHIRIN